MDRNQRINALLGQFLEVDAGDRRRMLEKVESDPSIVADVLELLDSDSDTFLDEPVVKKLGRGGLGSGVFDSRGDTALPEIQGYSVQRLLGEGGMGRVYLGEQESVD
ncbi:MAG: hypothetical protein AAFX50_14990, partial [Acidobacteriota bacterium]